MIKEKFQQLHNLLLQEKPEPAAIIVWLQGDRFDRGPKVLDLFNKKYAPQIMITGNNRLVGPKARPGEDNVSLTEMYTWLIEQGVPKNSLLIDEQSMNTKDQATTVIASAIKQNWQKIILVGSSFYQPRAFLTFLKTARVLGFAGRIINQPVIISDDATPSGRRQIVAALFEEEIKKIDQYQNDLETIDQGIDYLLANQL